jgi:hypothetical protein
MRAQSPGQKTAWFIVRLCCLVGMIPAVPGSYSEIGATNALFLLLGGLAFSVVVGVWLYVSPDKSGEVTTADLIWFCPLWPLMHFKRALWILLGMMIVSGGTAECIENLANGKSLLGGVATSFVGIMLIATAFVIGRIKGHQGKAKGVGPSAE